MSNPNQNFIAGEWLAGVGEIDNVNPSDLSDTIGRYAQADDAQLQRALDAAETAQREWAKAGLERRYNVLMAIGNELIARCEELGTLLALSFRAILYLLRGGGAAPDRRQRRLGARRYRGRRAPRTGGHGGGYFSMEFPDGDRGVEDCPRACLR
jgi:hypothetical protein